MSENILLQKPAGENLRLERVTTLGAQGAGVELEFQARRWWSDGELGKLRVRLASVLETSLNLQPGREFQMLSVDREHPILWEYGKRGAVFGQDALPDPYRFFLEFHRVVKDQLRSPRAPIYYLNWRGSMNAWLEMVYSRTFSLMNAPIKIAEAAADLLEAQAASYIVLPEPAKAGPSPELVLSFDQSWLVGSGLEIETE